MTTVDLFEHLFGLLDEIIFPALTAWAIFMLKSWLAKHRPPNGGTP